MSDEEQGPTLLDQLTWLRRLGDKHGLHEAAEWVARQVEKELDPNALLKKAAQPVEIKEEGNEHA